MEDCIFCKIINKEIPTNPVYEDDKILAFNDIDPKAPVHILIIPKKHMGSVLEVNAEDKELIGHIHYVAAELARKMGIAESGFRLSTNCNQDAGQVVFHLHFHLLGGKKLGSFW